jgi:glutamate synthase (NADPH) large chain
MPQDAGCAPRWRRSSPKVIEDEGQTAARLARRAGRQFLPVEGARGRGDRAGPPPGLHRPRRRSIVDEDAFERRLYILRKVISNRIYAAYGGAERFYVVSMSAAPLVYKGMFLAYQLGAYYRDLHDPRFESALALVHQRFSTNTFPSWKLAHPYRMVATTARSTRCAATSTGWRRGRPRSILAAVRRRHREALADLLRGPVRHRLLRQRARVPVRAATRCAHAAMMLIPEAWAGNPLMDEERRAFYEYHAALMEPWDGPAAIAFTDGRQIGATLDRNGLRPARYSSPTTTEVIMASEAGVLPVPERRSSRSGGCSRARCCSSTSRGPHRLRRGDQGRARQARIPTRSGWKRTQIVLEDLPGAAREPPRDVPLLDRQQAFGYTQEDLKLLMAPMATTGQEASARWATTRRSRRCRTSRSCSTPISSRTSRRSPTRRSTRSARSW